VKLANLSRHFVLTQSCFCFVLILFYSEIYEYMIYDIQQPSLVRIIVDNMSIHFKSKMV